MVEFIEICGRMSSKKKRVKCSGRKRQTDLIECLERPLTTRLATCN